MLRFGLVPALPWCGLSQGPQTPGACGGPQGLQEYEPSYVHMDMKYLPQMLGENSRRYLFVAIDLATRRVFVQPKSNSRQCVSLSEGIPRGLSAQDQKAADR